MSAVELPPGQTAYLEGDDYGNVRMAMNRAKLISSKGTDPVLKEVLVKFTKTSIRKDAVLSVSIDANLKKLETYFISAIGDSAALTPNSNEAEARIKAGKITNVTMGYMEGYSNALTELAQKDGRGKRLYEGFLRTIAASIAAKDNEAIAMAKSIEKQGKAQKQLNHLFKRINEISVTHGLVKTKEEGPFSIKQAIDQLKLIGEKMGSKTLEATSGLVANEGSDTEEAWLKDDAYRGGTPMAEMRAKLIQAEYLPKETSILSNASLQDVRDSINKMLKTGFEDEIAVLVAAEEQKDISARVKANFPIFALGAQGFDMTHYYKAGYADAFAKLALFPNSIKAFFTSIAASIAAKDYETLTLANALKRSNNNELESNGLLNNLMDRIQAIAESHFVQIPAAPEKGWKTWGGKTIATLDNINGMSFVGAANAVTLPTLVVGSAGSVAESDLLTKLGELTEKYEKVNRSEKHVDIPKVAGSLLPVQNLIDAVKEAQSAANSLYFKDGVQFLIDAAEKSQSYQQMDETINAAKAAKTEVDPIATDLVHAVAACATRGFDTAINEFETELETLADKAKGDVSWKEIRSATSTTFTSELGSRCQQFIDTIVKATHYETVCDTFKNLFKEVIRRSNKFDDAEGRKSAFERTIDELRGTNAYEDQINEVATGYFYAITVEKDPDDVNMREKAEALLAKIKTSSKGDVSNTESFKDADLISRITFNFEVRSNEPITEGAKIKVLEERQRYNHCLEFLEGFTAELVGRLSGTAKSMYDTGGKEDDPNSFIQKTQNLMRATKQLEWMKWDEACKSMARDILRELNFPIPDVLGANASGDIAKTLDGLLRCALYGFVNEFLSGFKAVNGTPVVSPDEAKGLLIGGGDVELVVAAIMRGLNATTTTVPTVINSGFYYVSKNLIFAELCWPYSDYGSDGWSDGDEYILLPDALIPDVRAFRRECDANASLGIGERKRKKLTEKSALEFTAGKKSLNGEMRLRLYAAPGVFEEGPGQRVIDCSNYFDCAWFYQRTGKYAAEILTRERDAPTFKINSHSGKNGFGTIKASNASYEYDSESGEISHLPLTDNAFATLLKAIKAFDPADKKKRTYVENRGWQSDGGDPDSSTLD